MELTTREATRLQRDLCSRVVRHDDLGPVKYVAGGDVSYDAAAEAPALADAAAGLPHASGLVAPGRATVTLTRAGVVLRRIWAWRSTSPPSDAPNRSSSERTNLYRPGAARSLI